VTRKSSSSIFPSETDQDATKVSIAYLAVAAELRGAIAAGDYPPGRRLPTENELASQKGLSRQTIRRAFQELVNEGVIYRVRGLGTFAIPGDAKYLRSFGSVDDLLALSLDTEMEVVEPLHVRASDAAAARLGVDDLVMAISFTRLHKGESFCFTRVFLPRAVGEKLKQLPEMAQLSEPGARARETVIGLLEQIESFSIHGADQDVTAAAAAPDIARFINCRPEQPVLRIERLYWDRDRQPLELAVNHFNPDLYSYRLELRGSMHRSRATSRR
jgi:GntR family transcriptional regulator